MRYVVFDTETPNSRNDRMSQIGVCLVEDGEILFTHSWLVNPECGFDAFNVMLTGITPEMASAAPCFGELWELTLSRLFAEGVLVAHNAPFDMGVLAKCLAAYGIRWRSEARYIDTVRMARRAFPAMPNHKLDTLAYHLGLELERHDAGSDAFACAQILLECVRRGERPADFERGYDLLARRTLQCAR